VNETGDVRIDEMMPRLCEAWPLVPFEQCLIPAIVSYRKLKSADIKTSGRIPVIDQGEIFISGYTNDPADEYPGALPVIVFGDHTRRFKFVDFKFAVGAQGTHLLYPCADLAPKFFYLYLCTLNLESQGYSRHYKFLKQALIPVPPLPEQRRIVAKLEKLLGKVDACHQRLAKIPVLLKRFRESVLAAGCSGRLTADWRQAKGESSSIIEIPDTTYEAPANWKSAPLGELAKFIDYRGRTPKKIESGIPLITAKNIRQGYIDREPREFIHEEDYDSWMTRGIPRLGDVLITTEAPLGYVAAVDITEKFALAQRAICLQFHDQRNQGFALLCMMSPVFQGMLTEQSTGTTVSGIKASRLKRLHLLLPPVGEQKEIVRRVEALFALADHLEARYAKARAHVERLTQSILAKAFRGELVPQDPNDEPASVLLQRIRNAKSSSDQGRKRSSRALLA
jgi:restriction endonuclease S subunit